MRKVEGVRESGGVCIKGKEREEMGCGCRYAVERMVPFSVALALALGGEHCKIQSR